MSVSAWSYSRWAQYSLCPAQFKYRNIDKLPTKQSKSMARGNIVHLEMKNYVNKKTLAMPEYVLVQHHKDLVNAIRDFDDKVVEKEWGFNMHWKQCGYFAPETWLRAKLDVGVLYEDMEGEAIDWKTGKVYSDNDDQMELFALTFMRYFPPATKVTTRLVYLDEGEDAYAEFDAKDQEKLMDKWNKRVAPMFADHQFLPRPNDKCRFCDYAKGKGGPCRFG